MTLLHSTMALLALLDSTTLYQWRSQAGAHWGTCPSNWRLCPTGAGTLMKNLVMYRLPHEKKNYGFTPNLDFNPLPTIFNFTEFLPPSEVAMQHIRGEENK